MQYENATKRAVFVFHTCDFVRETKNSENETKKLRQHQDSGEPKPKTESSKPLAHKHRHWKEQTDFLQLVRSSSTYRDLSDVKSPQQVYVVVAHSHDICVLWNDAFLFFIFFHIRRIQQDVIRTTCSHVARRVGVRSVNDQIYIGRIVAYTSSRLS